MGSWILIEHGRVIDGAGNPPRPDTSVLIRNGRIDRVGDAASVAAHIPESQKVTRIDATGKTVMPGLIDAHCHMTYGESLAQEEMDLYTSHEMRTLIAASNLKKVLRAGVTSISQPGGSYYIGVALREGMKAGLLDGPRMAAAGRYLTTSNGLADGYPDSVGVPAGNIGVLTNTMPKMVDEIRHQVKNGVDFIKIADSPYGQWQAFSNDELKAIADLSHQLRRRCTIHARGSAEVGAAVDAGFDWIMHGNLMTDEVIEKLAASKIPLVPTLLLLANLADWGDLVGSPNNQRDGCRRMLEKTADTLHRAHAAGVVMAVGTDSGFSVTPYGEWHAKELELLMVYAGLNELEAIRAGTRNAAITTNEAGRVGEIAEDMLADVIVVNGDPSRNIRVLVDKRNIEVVIKAGEIVRFDDPDLDVRHGYREHVVAYAQKPLTYDVVYGDGAPVGHEVIVRSVSDSKDLLGSLEQRELDAQAVVDA
jgi:imidazolonepropionase-like amidohydrolase